MQRSHTLVAAAAGLAFVVLQWLRWEEPPGLDQSLFVYYGHWLGRGLTLYRDLWDSKPPGIFALYALGERIAGVSHAPRLLDALATAACGILAGSLAWRMSRLDEPPANHAGRERFVAAATAALLAAFLWSAPPFGGPIVAAQAEVLMAPLLLGAALVSRRAGRRAGMLAGVLLGCAVCTKLVAVALLPIAWLFAPPRERWRIARSVWILAGGALPLAVAAALLAARVALGDAVEAAILFPRVYAAEIADRMPLVPALGRGLDRFRRGLPLLLVLGLAGACLPPRNRLVVPSLGWLLLAAAGIAAQRQMASYHLVLALPPLVLLAAAGVGRLVGLAPVYWKRARHGEGRALVFVAIAALVGLLAGGVEVRLWLRHYAPHVALRTGRLESRDEFWTRLGGPGPAWLEATRLAGALREIDPNAVASRESLLVWGLAPAVYAATGRRPATRYCFHQTLLVEHAPLARRWPGATQRRAELMETMQRTPPRWIVVVAGDRSGLEPQDSRAELREFPELETLLATHYGPGWRSRTLQLFVRAPH